MPDFTYVARNPTGQQATGILTANSERDAMAQLDQKGLFPVRIEPAKSKSTGGLGFRFGGRIKGRQLTTCYAQLADLLHSGVPLLRSLEILERQSSSPAFKEILRDVKAKVADGTSLADAMGQHPRAFTDLAVSMIRAGQEGGFLEEVLKRIAEFTDHQEDLKAKVVGALAYPVFLSIVGTLIVGGLVIFLVPQFKDMFEQQGSGSQLPTLTRGLLAVSDFIQRFWWLLLGVGLGGFFGLRRWMRSPGGRWTVDTWKLKLPMAGSIWCNLATSRFCRTLGTLLHNGIPLLTSLRISKDSAGNLRLADAIDKAADSVKDGQSLAPPLLASGYFPLDIVEIIGVGEESNTLDNVLVNIANSTEKRTTRQIELMVRLLEPIMLLIMAAITLVVVLALLLPFLSVNQMVK